MCHEMVGKGRRPNVGMSPSNCGLDAAAQVTPHRGCLLALQVVSADDLGMEGEVVGCLSMVRALFKPGH